MNDWSSDVCSALVMLSLRAAAAAAAAAVLSCWRAATDGSHLPANTQDVVLYSCSILASRICKIMYDTLPNYTKHKPLTASCTHRNQSTALKDDLELHWNVTQTYFCLEFLKVRLKQYSSLTQEAQLMLTNPRVAVSGQSRSTNMVPLDMLGVGH